MMIRNALTLRNTFAAAVAVCLALSPLVAQAAPTAPPSPALHTIQGNADAARANAQIFQWKRVNLEVDRITAAERALESAGADDTSLRAAILSLRSARQAHDSDATVRAAAAVSALCDSLAR